MVIYGNGENLELECFLDYIENNKPVEKGSLEQTILALAARDSAEKGETVKFSQQ